jgi:hypothetical protein
MTYKLNPPNSDLLNPGQTIPNKYVSDENGTFVLIDGDSSESLKYQAWLAEGNTPLPAE